MSAMKNKEGHGFVVLVEGGLKEFWAVAVPDLNEATEALKSQLEWVPKDTREILSVEKIGGFALEANGVEDGEVKLVHAVKA